MTAPAATPAAGVSAGTPSVVRWLVLSTFVVILNETVMINAIPRLIADLDIGDRAAPWLSTVFLLTMAAVIPVTGWFLVRFSTRTAYRTAMTVFCAGTLLAALAPGFEVLLAARAVQAMGTAVMMPLLMTTLMQVVPEHDRGRVMGNVTLAISVAPALGPTLSGVILEYASWRWVFGVVLPIAVAVALVSLRRIEDLGEPAGGPIDWPSVGLAGLGFGGFVYGLSRLGGPGAAWTALLVTAGLAVIALFAARQRRLQRVGSPLLDLRTLGFSDYRVSLLLMSVAFMAMLGTLVLLPRYLQEVRGLSELSTGLLVLPGGLAMGVLGPRVGRWYDRLGARAVVVPGAVLLLVASALLTQVGADTPYAVVLGAHVLMMAGLASVFTPTFTLGLGALPPHLYSHGSSLLGTVQQVAGAVGTAVTVAVLATVRSGAAPGTPPAASLLDGLHWAFVVGAVLSVAVLGLALRLPRGGPVAHAGAAAGAPDEVLAAGADPLPLAE